MSRHVTRAELLRMRLRSQGLVASARAKTPVDVVRRLFAIQGQDLPGALWSIGRRTESATRNDVVAAFNSGELVRIWPFRGTLHVVDSANLGWVLDITGSRTIASTAKQRRELGIDNEVLDDARRTAKDLLAGGSSATRREFATALTAGGIDTSGQRGGHILRHLCLDGTLVLGPIDGTEQKIVLTDDWVPASRRREPDDPLREIVVRYLAGHGPARVDDIAGWAKLPLGMIRAGLDAAVGELTSFDYRSTTFWAHKPTLGAVSDAKPADVLALPGFDELLLGYSDRTASLNPEHARLTVPGNNGMFRPTVIARGRVVGLWTRKTTAKSTVVTATPFDAGFSQRVKRGLVREFRRYGRFVQMPSEVTVVD